MYFELISLLNSYHFQDGCAPNTDENVTQNQITNSNHQNSQNHSACGIRIQNDTIMESQQNPSASSVEELPESQPNQNTRVDELPTVCIDNAPPSYEDLFPQSSSHK